MEIREDRIAGRLPEGVAYVDIETEKVALADPVPGFPRRWRPILVGIVRDGYAYRAAGTEAELIEWATEMLAGVEVRYAATKRFDELILKGRFTHARRPPLAEPGPWPAIPKAYPFRNLGRLPAYPGRAADVASREVPASWASGDREPVWLHLLRDLAELVSEEGDAEARAWAATVLV